MESKTNLSEIHAELSNWVKELVFYKEELKMFQNKLEELVKKNNSHDFMAEVEHFQNQFIRQHEVVDTLKHDFKQVDNRISQELMNNPSAAATASMVMDPVLLDEHDTFLKIYNELKSDFEKFLARSY